VDAGYNVGRVVKDMRIADMLAGLLDTSAVRQKVVAHNIANVNTPGFKRSEVNFEDDLKAALAHNDMDKAATLKPEVAVSDDPALRNDGNNVDIDKEVGRLTKNALLYSTYVNILSRKFSLLNSAITGKS